MAQWNFLTNHAYVLICIARNQNITAREIAQTIGITERGVQNILDDLEDSGYLRRSREGRNNTYAIDPSQSMRPPQTLGDVPVSDLINLFNEEPGGPDFERDLASS
jgi:DNA-binding transcriptional ArsR family regulator